MAFPRTPDATGDIHIEASPEQVYALVSDPGVLAELAGEYEGFRWLGDATESAVGARFRGRNRHGSRRWSTTSVITDATDGEVFAFDVGVGPWTFARWEYDIEPDAPGDGPRQGCRVVESTWDYRPGWIRFVTGKILGVRDRAELNRRNIAATLAALKQRAETVAAD